MKNSQLIKNKETCEKNTFKNQGKNMPPEDSHQSWDQFYSTVDSFEEYANAPHIKHFLKTVLNYWHDGKILEVGTGTGYMSIWLSRSFPYNEVMALDQNKEIVRRAAYMNGALSGKVAFCEGSAFNLASLFPNERFDVIFHQGFLEHFSDEEIIALLEQQLRLAHYVIFSVPSKFYPRIDFGDERLMELEDWLKILAPFGPSILSGEYYSHDRENPGNEELSFVLRGTMNEREKSKDGHLEIDRDAHKISVVPAHEYELIWRSSVFNPSGYAHQSRNAAIGMDMNGIRVCLDPMVQFFEGDFDASTWERLIRMTRQKPRSPAPLVMHHPPAGFKGEDFFQEGKRLYPGMSRYIGSVLFESDRLPESWVPALNAMDEIWVQTEFNFETFSRSGIDRSKIQKIPSGINPFIFNRNAYAKANLPNKKSFNFISIFEWTKRKGYDILLKAFLQEFTYREDVGLVMFVYRGSGTNAKDKETASEKAARYALQQLGIDLRQSAHVSIVESVFPNYSMPSIYAAADAFILPSRGEGWGMPYMEAMAMEIPAIGTRWGGNTEFMNDNNSFLIDIEGLEPVDEEQVKDNMYYNGHQWARPSIESAQQIMREVFENRKESREKARKGREDILNNWTIKHIGEKIYARLLEIEEEDSIRGRARSILKPVDPASQITWKSPISGTGGYAESARNSVLALKKHTSLNLKVQEFQTENPYAKIERDKEEIIRDLSNNTVSENGVHIWQTIPPHFAKDKSAYANIGYTSFDSDSLPEEWVERCNSMDEIWVPSEFNVNTFFRAGVKKEKLCKVPPGIDTDLFPGSAAPLYIPGKMGFNFLSIFDWDLHKGWDILIRSFLKEFKNTEDVALIIKTYSSSGLSTQEIAQQIKKYITRDIGIPLDSAPGILLIERMLTEKEMVQLYKTADAYVMPSRGEGRGRSYMEAMAMGLPTIGTRWSGNLEFMNDKNSFLIDCEIVDVPQSFWKENELYHGHRWAEPSADHLRKLMRNLFTDQYKTRKIADAGQREIREKYNWRAISEIILNRINGIITHGAGTNGNGIPRGVAARKHFAPKRMSQTSQQGMTDKHTIIWEGSQMVCHSLARVNREICSRLQHNKECDISIIPFEPEQNENFDSQEKYRELLSLYNKPLARDAEFHIRHHWPPNFTPPSRGKWILMQPWEFGYLPMDWIKPIREQIDEVWVYSIATKNVYVESGIQENKVHVIPLGVDPSLFGAHVSPLSLPIKKRFKFLFVGGTIWRKGIDILLDAYVNTFRNTDDVCLVIKDMGTQSFYQGMNARKNIENIQNTPGAPEILYLDQTLRDEELPKLYASCDCLVHPYRGEGFGLPVAEAMACGLPVIVTRGGSTDDFCPPEFVYPIASSHVPVTIEVPLIKQGWVLNPDKKQLIDLMREVYQNPQNAKKRAGNASQFIINNFTWDRTVEAVMSRLKILGEEKNPPLRFSARALQGDSSKSNGRSVPSVPDNAGSRLSQPEIEKLLERGDSLFDKGSYAEALPFYMDIHAQQPHNIETAVKCAETFARLNNHEMAEKVLTQCAHANPDNKDIHNFLGVYLVHRKKLDEAKAIFQRAYDIDPDDLITMRNQMELLFMQGNFAEVIPLCERILENDSANIDARLMLGNSHAFSGNLDKAKREYETVLKVDPQNRDAIQNCEIIEETLAKAVE